MGKKRAILEPVVVTRHVRWLCFFTICMVGGFGFLGYRLYDIQVLQHDELAEKARDNTERVFVRESRRGDIRDIRGNLLATSKLVHAVCADPDFIGTNYLAIARQIAPVLGMPLEEVAKKLEPRTRTNSKGEKIAVKYVCLKRRVEDEEWKRVQEAMRQVDFGVNEALLKATQKAAYDRLRSRALYSLPEEIRYYPNDTLAAHVLGYVGNYEKVTGDESELELVGKEGLEASLNASLTGISGWRQTETDGKRRELVQYRENDVAPRNGLTAVLTIDSGVQHIVEDEIATAFEKHTPISISATIVRPRTGEILAMANLPTFNPNFATKYKAEERRNRVVTDVAEPGSTFKIVVVSAGINEGITRLDEVFDCENGRFYFAGLPLSDDHKFGMLTVEQIVSRSSNIGAAKIGIRLGEDKLYEYVRAFGFGERTGILMPAEARGTIRPVPKWTKISISRIPMGHEVNCTSLQMVMAMSAIANQGVLMRPIIVDRLVNEQGKVMTQFHPEAVRRVVSSETAAKVVTALKSVVSTNGTARTAKLTYYTAAGKTGTAQKIVNGRYSRSSHFTSFIGFFPADNPELCISVVLDDPKKGYYGSEAAAPVFQRIAERVANYLAIPPEFVPNQNLAISNVNTLQHP
jgi:cell division protein FtsI/penicillin-binding protein 2